MTLGRCRWVNDDPLYIAYHDEEWGVASRDDRHLFEMLILEGAQAGLSWYTILKKREGYRRAFAGFDAARVARFSDQRLERLSRDPSIVRHRQKIAAARSNARAALAVMERHGSLAAYLWAFVDGEPVVNRWRDAADVPVSTPASDAMSKALRADGFKFAGTTICYAFMQATGMVNDHVQACFRCPPAGTGAAARPGALPAGESRETRKGTDPTP